MNGKYKMTGCARILIFLLILAPIAYFGAKYLNDSGKLDEWAQREEQRERGNVEYGQDREPMDLPSAGASISQDQFDRLRKEYEEQELIIANQTKKIKDLEAENAQLRSQRSGTTYTPPPTQTNTQRPHTTNNNGSPSMDDLLREADSNLGTSSSGGSSSGYSQKKSYGEWGFTYSGISGVIEFFEQNGKLYSRTAASGQAAKIDELRRSGDKFVVVGSPTGEYYQLTRAGDLEAYDREGYQTTCRRR